MSEVTKAANVLIKSLRGNKGGVGVRTDGKGAADVGGAADAGERTDSEGAEALFCGQKSPKLNGVNHVLRVEGDGVAAERNRAPLRVCQRGEREGHQVRVGDDLGGGHGDTTARAEA